MAPHNHSNQSSSSKDTAAKWKKKTPKPLLFSQPTTDLSIWYKPGPRPSRKYAELRMRLRQQVMCIPSLLECGHGKLEEYKGKAWIPAVIVEQKVKLPPSYVPPNDGESNIMAYKVRFLTSPLASSPAPPGFEPSIQYGYLKQDDGLTSKKFSPKEFLKKARHGRTQEEFLALFEVVCPPFLHKLAHDKVQMISLLKSAAKERVETQILWSIIRHGNINVATLHEQHLPENVGSGILSDILAPNENFDFFLPSRGEQEERQQKKDEEQPQQQIRLLGIIGGAERAAGAEIKREGQPQESRLQSIIIAGSHQSKPARST